MDNIHYIRADIMNNKIKRILHSKNIRNSEWIIGQQVFQMLIQFIVGILVARYLGPSNYGSLNYTASFVTFASSITTLGMDSVVIKKIIDHPDEEGIYLGSCIGFRLLASVFSIISVSLVVYILNPTEPVKLVLVFLQSFELFFRAMQLLDSWFQCHLISKYVSIGKIVASLIVSSYKIYLLASSKSIVWFAVCNSMTEGIIAAFEVYYYKKKGNQKLQFDASYSKEVLRESYHFIIAGIMTAIYSQMDRVMIGQMMTDKDVGLYSTATAISGMWLFIPIAIINSFQPLIIEMKKNGNEHDYLRRLKQLYSFVIWLCIIVSLIICIFASSIINILYGAEYINAVSTLRISIWFETFAIIGTARGIWILCEKKNKYVKYYLFIGVIVNLILNYTMIPIYGINGAAVATLITQITTSIIAPLFFKETKIHSKIVWDAVIFKWDK